MRFTRPLKILTLALVVGAGLCFYQWLPGQETAPDAPPPEPKGVEVMARGPIHEAFASPTAEPAPTKSVPKQPPKPVNEMPPEEKPAGNVVWIGGYWAWDDDRNDFLWVSGIWRTLPPSKQWVAGYWREDGDQWQWVGGFWTDAAAEDGAAKDVTYLPKPPAPPVVAPPGDPPSAECFYVPGTYLWNGTDYVWRAGYWAKVQPGYVWVPAHYRWTPSGYIHIAGYWDLAMSRRGFLYAPVVVDYAVVGPTFVYTPTYAVSDTVVLDAMFVRPCTCHYYFGDYYGVRYRDYGFESCVVYSQRNYDAIIVYERYERRSDPTWINIQINLCSRRDRGEEPCPPRTLAQQNIIQQNIIQQNIIQQNTVVNNTVVNNVNTTNVNNTVVNNKAVYKNTLLMPAAKLAQQKNVQVVKLDAATRNQALTSSRAMQQVAAQRSKTEVASAGIPTRPRTAPLSLPKVQPVRAASEPKMTVPDHKVTPQTQHNNAKPQTGQAPNRNATVPNTGTSPNRSGTAPNTGTSPNRNAYQPPHTDTAPNRPGYPPSRTGTPPTTGNPGQQRNAPQQQRNVNPAQRPGQPPARPAVQPNRQPPPKKNPPDNKKNPPNG
jgi:hypothetical protein